MLSSFHPAVRTWFERRFPAGPTTPQAGGWAQIAAGRHTLIAAPTGSGKTLAAFLVCIDRIYRAHERGEEPSIAGGSGPSGSGVSPGGTASPRASTGPQVVYVSPLKALATDIWQNLDRPLAEIAEVAAELGLPAPDISVAVRTGDTAAAQRAAMLRRPPDFLITTPESLYLLVTAQRSRAMLRGVRTVIVDEIHAVASNKRGSHLALTLERLAHLAEQPVQRVGLSATQRPIQVVARLLVGAGQDRDHPDGSPRCAIVDSGHQRDLDLSLDLPGDELGAVATTGQMDEIVDLIAAQVAAHATTLVFVNTRRLAERVAHQLGERLGDGEVAAHHGSLSRERRQRVEARLRGGDLRALVATASLELGIDVGPVDFVCQIGSPRSFATFLQRVGRSNHTRAGVPAGRLYPTSRDELVECAALLHGARNGRLDALVIPSCPLDILAQQVVAECAAADWAEADMLAMVRGAAPFSGVSAEDFEQVTELVSEGIRTGRGRRAAYLHRDQVTGQLRGRRGARIAALTSGGAIPELGDYRVLAEPDEALVGTVNEDWAIESAAGDVFLLGTTSWRIRKVEPGIVRVVDAHGAPPSVPFWLGEAPGRTLELSQEVCALRSAVAGQLAEGGPAQASRWLIAECGVGDAAAETITAYLGTGLAQLGVLPTMDTIVLERFFDDAGGMQLVGHAPFGARLNRALGLALRKRFCVTFDFELQAAASDDAILLSLGPQHSFPLERVPKFLASGTVEQVVRQAVLTAPMFAVRWRWNLNTSLAVLRMRGGKKNPPAIQRMEADDLMAAVFPTLAACQENVAPGPLEIPDHVLVRQTLDDCLHEAMDIDGLTNLVRRIEAGAVNVVVRDTTEPSVLAHEILNGRPFTYLDAAPLEERRSRQVPLRRGLPVEPHELSNCDPAAIERVAEQVRPDPRDPDELHDLLLTLVALRPAEPWRPWFDALVAGRRAVNVRGPAGELWAAVERRAAIEVLYPDAGIAPDYPSPVRTDPPEEESAVAGLLRGHLDCRGPSTLTALVAATGLRESLIIRGLAVLEAEGFVIRGRFTADSADAGGSGGSSPRADTEEYCARRLLARIHGYTRERRRREVEPVNARDFMRFLLRWQHVAPGTRREGRLGLLAVIEQLQGYELAAGAWENSVLAARLDGYRRDWLDQLCLSGQVTWGRLAAGGSGGSPPRADAAGGSGGSPPRADAAGGSGGSPPRADTAPAAPPVSPAPAAVPLSRAPASQQANTAPIASTTLRASTASRATPITLALRDDLPWLLRAARRELTPAEPGADGTRDVLDALRQQGALFRHDLAAATGRPLHQIDEALWDGVARGMITADGFAAIRSLLRRGGGRPIRPRRGLRRGLNAAAGGTGSAGRWSLLPAPIATPDSDELAEAVAEQLAARWGVVFKDLVARENLAVGWRELQWAFRRMEARGTMRGGRFVTGFSGEQYAHPDAVEALRSLRKQPRTGQQVQVSAADPLNLTGIVLPGPRVPAVGANTVTYVDGAVIDTVAEPAAATA